MVMPKSYDDLVERLAFAESRKRNEDLNPSGLTYKCYICGGIFPKGSGHVHKVTQMTEEETAAEISQVTEGVLHAEPAFSPETAPLAQAIQPKKRGRPKGSRNKPKESK